ncbi:MAG: DNA-processing protein DprA [Promicromonosporaceae bacterium]|nr:DNA-processing protein DprA [Promicromonosporaceae bacterium]
MNTVPFDIDDPRLAAAAWSRLAEPGDEVAGTLVAHLGTSGALAWLLKQHHGVQSEALAAGVARWSTRLPDLDARRDLRALDLLGGTLLLPDDPRWPAGLRDLGVGSPFVLWVRGDPDLAAACRRMVALVGARAATGYGEHVARKMAAGLSDRGFGVVSGGAYGIDAAAHHGILVAGGHTLAVLAGGVDQLYPRGNHNLLTKIIHRGAIIAEMPPGAAPHKQRFLSRNRLIAALADATVVVEAAWRSGALSTARHAAALLRPVGAVPGPVTSMTSGGCHQLLRDGLAVCVTDAAEVAELAGSTSDVAEAPAGELRAIDDLDPIARAVLDALPLRASIDTDSLLRDAGHPLPGVLGALGLLELRGLIEADGARWRRKRASAVTSGRKGVDHTGF